MDNRANGPPNPESSAPPLEGACGSCPQAHECRTVWSQPNRGPFNSAGLVLSSITAFLLPLVTAVVGGGIARNVSNRPGWTFGGVVLGLAAGVLLAWLLVPWIQKKCPAVEECPLDPQNSQDKTSQNPSQE